MASSLWYTCDGRVALRDCVVFLIGIIRNAQGLPKSDGGFILPKEPARAITVSR
jgi:hypothetical protein